MSKAIKILLDELIEQSHPISVEKVIYQALQDHYKKGEETFGCAIAYSICKRIDEAEEDENFKLMNPEKINSIIK
ncbi:hypothetical protein [Tenacibaculum sp. 190524A02b]|uniref:hypothetical protein n=1 Tax=Tenacibaculum vairaonense TaxID=3137860 RepID=UPI0031FA7E13